MQRVCRRRAQKSLAVLAYHDVSDQNRFRKQIEFLRRERTPVALDDVIEAAQGKSELPASAVLVTFDDGHRSVLEHGLPVLQEFEVPAVVFVVASLLGTDQPFWWNEVEELFASGGTSAVLEGCELPEDVTRRLKRVANDVRLQAIEDLRRTAREPARRVRQLDVDDLLTLERQGIAIGNHTHTHPCLHMCSMEEIEQEFAESQQVLKEALGQAPRALAYPNGDHDPRVLKSAAEAGFEVAFLFDHKLSDIPPSNRLRTSRLRVDTQMGYERFQIVLSGLHPRIHSLLGRV